MYRRVSRVVKRQAINLPFKKPIGPNILVFAQFDRTLEFFSLSLFLVLEFFVLAFCPKQLTERRERVAHGRLLDPSLTADFTLSTKYARISTHRLSY